MVVATNNPYQIARNSKRLENKRIVYQTWQGKSIINLDIFESGEITVNGNLPQAITYSDLIDLVELIETEVEGFGFELNKSNKISKNIIKKIISQKQENDILGEISEDGNAENNQTDSGSEGGAAE